MKYKVTIEETNENQIPVYPINPVKGSPIMPERDSDYWDEQKAFFKRYE